MMQNSVVFFRGINNNFTGLVVNYSRFSFFLKSEMLSPVIFLKKRLKEAKSSKPRISAISLALFVLYRSKRFASASVRS